MEKYMKIALKEAEKAKKHGDVPIGAVIVKNNKIIAKGHNKKEIKNTSTRHAEIEVIEKACKKLKTWHLDDCVLYVTLEPCMMCSGAIEQSRIKQVFYGTENYNFGYMSKLSTVYSKNLNNNECNILLKKFFKSKR